jgi:hypothetical protein
VLTLHASQPAHVGYALASALNPDRWSEEARERLRSQLAAYDPENELVLCLVQRCDSRPWPTVSSRVIMTPPPRVCYARLAGAEGRLVRCESPWELPVRNS